MGIRNLGFGGSTGTGCGCCGSPPPPVCNTTICPIDCNGNPINGAAVAILSGGTTVASGTTSGDGCVTLNIGTAGTYTVDVSASGYNSFSSSETLSCAGTTTISMTLASGYTCSPCCGAQVSGGAVTPTVTDANGTYAMLVGTDIGSGGCYYAVAFTPVMSKCQQPGGCNALVSGTIGYEYYLSCNGFGVMTLQRWWGTSIFPGAGQINCLADLITSSACFGAVSACSGGPQVSSMQWTPTEGCGNSFSGTPVTVGSPTISDPVGGTVVVNY